MTRDRFAELANEMCENLSTDMSSLMLKAFDGLTADEIAKMDVANHPYFIVRAIGVAVGPRAIEDRFNVEAIGSIVRRVKAILKKRYWYW